MRRTLLMATLAVGLPALPADAAKTTIEARDNVFAPVSATVAVGDRVTWRNTGQAPHEVTASAFSSGNIDPGESWTWTANKAGTFSYVCQYHVAANMKGTLVVRAAAATGHPDTGGDDVRLGLLLLLAAGVSGATLRLGWRLR